MLFAFENPLIFLLLPLAFCFIYCKRIVSKKVITKLIWIPKRSRLFNTQSILKVLIFILIITSLSYPFTYNSIMPSSKYGRDIVLALDCSGSMRESGFSTKDDEKSKFELVQELSLNFIDKRVSDNIGVVVFGSFAYTASPITYDHYTLKELLDTLEVEIAGKNTAIGDALIQSITTLKFSNAKNKVIILLTDGISNSGKISIKQAVQKAKQQDIKVYTIGLGEKKEYNSKLLEKIATNTGAKSFSASNFSELKEVYKEIDSLNPSQIKSEQYLDKKPLFQYPLLLATLFFLLLIKSNRSYILYISLSLILVSLTRPTMQKDEVPSTIKGSDFILAVDVSKSMSALDLDPSRAQKAKMIVEKLISSNPHDRFTLLAFTTNALTLCPSTTDTTLLLSALNSLKIDNILTHGTSIENLLKKVAKLNIKEKNLIILSDGGDNLELKSLQKIASRNQINITTIATATLSGSTIKDRYNNTLKDKNNNIVITKLNPQFKELALQNHGKFMMFDNIDYSLGFIQKDNITNKKTKGVLELYYYPLSISLALFFFYFVRVSKKLFLLVPFLAPSYEAYLLDWYYIKEANKLYHEKKYKEAIKKYKQIDSPTIQTKLNIANTLYQSKQYKKAINIYLTLNSTDKDIKKLIYFKLANSFALIKDYEKARRYYKLSLQIKKDKNSLHNLKLMAFKKSGKKHINRGSSKQQKHNQSKTDKPSNPNNKKDNNNQNKKLTHPIGYKAYELINKGYIDEKTPW